MKLTKQLETEIKHVMDDYWNSYFEGNLDHWSNYLVEDYKNIGGTEEEIWNSKKEILDYTYRVIDQMKGATQLRNKQTQIIPYDPYIMVHELLDFYIKIENEWTFYQKFRLSTLLQKTGENWKVLHQHGSYPDSKTEIGEAFAFDEIKAENKKLKDAIKRRTIELEEKNRELQIEAALEKIRARSMAMQHSDELAATATILFEQFSLLGKAPERAAIEIVNEKEQVFEIWATQHGGKELGLLFKISFNEPHVMQKMYNAWKNQIKSITIDLQGKELEEYFDFLMGRGLPVDREKFGSRRVQHVATFSQGIVTIITPEVQSLETIQLLERFAGVFEQTYTRFLDLQRAEAQAREAQVEASLERVRARSMAMHNTEEMLEAAELLSRELSGLGINSMNVSYAFIDDKEDYASYYSLNPVDNKIPPFPFIFPHTETDVMRSILAGWKKQEPFHVIELDEEATTKHQTYIGKHIYDLIKKNNIGIPFSVEEFLAVSPPKAVLYSFNFNKGYLFHIGGEKLTSAQEELILRFTRVFEQTYTRFLDLQKAEAQAKEARIESALEKVRSRSLAMHRSEELQEIVTAVFDRLKDLDIEADAINLDVFSDDIRDAYLWTAVPGHSYSKEFHIPFNDTIIFRDIYDGMAGGKELHSKVYTRAEKDEFLTFIFEHSDFRNIPEERKRMLYATEASTVSVAYAKHIAIIAQRYRDKIFSDGENEILKRFAKVFEQAYVRFLDLKKAEAQAREAKIEAALERVRARSMSMHKSGELQEVIQVVYEQFVQLNMPVEHAGFIIDYKERVDMHIWLADRQSIPGQVTIPYFDSPHWNSFVEAKEKGREFFANHLNFEEKNKFYQELFSLFPGVQAEARDYYLNAPGLAISTVLLNDIGLYIENFSGTPYTDEENATLMRFGKVFQQTYTRFIDLQKAEALAREAQVEAGLERVRAKALAMQQPEELKDVAEVLRFEMGLLGVEELETCSIYIHEEQAEKSECWYALKDVRRKEKRLVTDHFSLNLNESWVGRQMLEFFNSAQQQFSIVMQGANRKEWIRYCEEKSAHLRGYYGDEIPDRTYHLYKFSHGAIGAAAVADISGESWGLLKRAASVFSLAYSRFKDLSQARIDLQKLKEEKKRAEDALTELQAAQTQLIQAEKMASLGELTAGIAHEIQNPLNFVNNFSEINKELIEELEAELGNDKSDEIIGILNYIKENEQKINHHGKRADGIVKGMLQHSRSNTGVKESTDINKLADEYLRLAYHGLRARDKSFNANLVTDYDESIGNINIIPQDIGRVILNMITNAFYAINSQIVETNGNGTCSKQQPTVWLKTMKVGDKVLVSVKDNGTGIPQKVLDKIFQPFFTTKPTGQGTGLGLSLSYDIVKSHGGSLKVETMEGVGSEFIIDLPV